MYSAVTLTAVFLSFAAYFALADVPDSPTYVAICPGFASVVLCLCGLRLAADRGARL